eukprot:TRINITY_DN1091_c0_g5_i1.p1 TRINITY_DN1091_c0_g5~~TRINITY_DN1091_c0_g5_i1.p1  ORF type:complete len:198 (+),score=33.11 TRINITY_DN1091_c0_g5_i1:29-595(+)
MHWVLNGINSGVTTRSIEKALGGGFGVEERMLGLRRVVVSGEGKPPPVGGCTVRPFQERRENRKLSRVVLVHICGWSGHMELASAIQILQDIEFPLYEAERVFIPSEAYSDGFESEQVRIIFVAMEALAGACACLGNWDATPLDFKGRELFIHCTQLAPREYSPNRRNKVFKVPLCWKPPPLLEEDEE